MNSASKPPKSPESEGKPESVTLLDTIKSVSASFFGVQSSKNRERDFTKGKPIHFIIIGVVMTVLFILAVWTAVKVALHSAGM
ncbi:MAG: DUF2970 domain-containing protein [Nevskiales bacterium]|nr:DUF2970 domain-containing protein [Nevskiales bacterium]